MLFLYKIKPFLPPLLASSNLGVLPLFVSATLIQRQDSSQLMQRFEQYEEGEKKDEIIASISSPRPEVRVIDFLKGKNLKYVFLYDNLQTDTVRKSIFLDTKGLSGIYMILNKVTMDYYIGSASTNRFYSRFSNHLIYFKGSKLIKNAVRKYKLPCFTFIILEIFPKLVDKETNKELLDLEDFYLKSLLPNYNILTEAGNSFGYKHSELDRIKMKAKYSQERRERIGTLNKGKKLSILTIEKMREKAINRPKALFSDTALANMKKKSKPILIYNLDKTIYGKYPSIIEAAKSLGCNDKTIRRALKTEKQILKRRYIVKQQIT